MRSALQTVEGQTSKVPIDVSTTRSRADARLTRALQRSQDQNDTIKSLRAKIVELRRDATAHRKTARIAEVSLSRKTDQLLKARESSRAQKDAIRSLGTQVRWLEREAGRLNRELEHAETIRQTARRLSFGSDSETGARFTALMYSVVATLKTNGIDVRRWLETWLRACAENGGRPPEDVSEWLPWSMSEERRRALTAPG